MSMRWPLPRAKTSSRSEISLSPRSVRKAVARRISLSLGPLVATILRLDMDQMVHVQFGSKQSIGAEEPREFRDDNRDQRPAGHGVGEPRGRGPLAGVDPVKQRGQG